MAAPTQELPPWLTPSAVVVTNAAGEIVTSTATVYLPLTYLGPSIPLGSLYTYGGSTYPPTLVTGFITTTASPTVPATTPSTTPPATPPTTATTPATTATTIPTISTSLSSSTTSTATVIPTGSTSSVTSSSPTSSGVSFTTSPTFSPTGSFTSTSTQPSNTSGSSSAALSRGQLVGVIVASILGLIFLFVFLLAMWLWCKGRRNRRSGQFSTIAPLDDDYFIVGEGGHTPGEGSPRHSGEEADPFLQRSSGMHEVATELGSRPGVPRVPPPATNSLSSSNSSSTNNSGYGVLLERPTLGILPPTAEEGEMPFGGYHMSEEEVRQMHRESVLPEDEEEYTGAYAIAKDPALVPPRLVDPDHAFALADIPHPQLLPSAHARSSVQSNPSLMESEGAALLTARRVRVGEIPVPGFSEGEPNLTQSGFLTSIGLTGLTNISRLSWFGAENSPPGSTSRRHSPPFPSLPLSETDMESGRAMLQPNFKLDSFGRRVGVVGDDVPRPISSISARSGTSVSVGTVWHDARSSLPGTPGLVAQSRAPTPAEPTYPEHAWISGHQPPHSPPAYDDPFVDNSPPLDVTPDLPSNVDILDFPAPPTALTHFASSSSMHDSGTVSSIGLTRNPFPPGLDFVAKGKSWSRDGSLSASSASPAWHQVSRLGEADYQAPVSVDILEEEPPNAGTGWRTMASGSVGIFGELGSRTTFGLPHYTHPSPLASEQASLHSMRSHINPSSIRSTGSAPAAHRDGSQHSGSLSSNSSKPSTHSASSSISHSLGRSGSLISDGRRRFDPHMPGSPPVSAFGLRGFQTPPRVATPADVGLFKHGEIPTIDGSNDITMPSVHFSPGASTIRTIHSGSTTMQGGRTRTVSAVTGAGGERVLEDESERLPLSDVNTRLLGNVWMPSI